MDLSDNMLLVDEFFGMVLRISAMAASTTILCLAFYLALSKTNRFREFIAARLVAFLVVLVVAFLLMRSV